MSLRNLMAGLLLCLTVNTLFAEVKTYKGNVKDDSGHPLEFVNVTFQNLNDSTLIDGAVTDAEGNFSVSGDGNSVFLKVSAMGFEDRIINNPTPNLGDIFLAPGARRVNKRQSDADNGGHQYNVPEHTPHGIPVAPCKIHLNTKHRKDEQHHKQSESECPYKSRYGTVR